MSEVWSALPGGPGYPSCLGDLDDAAGLEAPIRLNGRGDRGILAGLDPARTVTIVGARRCTDYGRAVAMDLAASLASAGVVVVSGMAFGIDQAVHRGALAAGGATVAVLACGPDRAYPPSSRSLYRRLVQRGAVVSEAEPGYVPARWDFPKRNRIMAALAAMTIVVEARDPSGSRVTADRALQLGREVGAVPGPVGAPLSAGPHALIRDGASLVRGAQDVLDQLFGVGARAAVRVGPRLDREVERVLEAIGAAGMALSDMSDEAGVAPGRAAVALAQLELAGYVTTSAGRWYRTGLTAP
jgi:DNA processing protein